jgi:hypothetical protein
MKILNDKDKVILSNLLYEIGDKSLQMILRRAIFNGEDITKVIAEERPETKPTHEVLDLIYTPDEGQECFQGSEKECYDFIQQQGGADFMYKVVPIVFKK